MPLIKIDDAIEGVFPVILAGIEGPKEVTVRATGEKVKLLTWKFVILDGKYKDTEVEGTTSIASGPRSKLYGWLTALYNGIAPKTGSEFDESDLTGRMALATIQPNETGWPKVVSLGAVPAGMLGQQVATATGAPVSGPASAPAPAASGVVTPLREQVAAGSGELPF